MLSEFKQGFVDERRVLEGERKGCMNTELLRFYNKKILILRLAKTMCVALVMTASKSNLPHIGDLGLALSLLIPSENFDELMNCWRDVTTTVDRIRSEMRTESVEKLNQEKEKTNEKRGKAMQEMEKADQEKLETKRKAVELETAEFDKIAAERRTHCLLWQIFN
jgi:hypothetical protein